MSLKNRKREYNRLVGLNRVPPKVLLDEFGAVPTPKEPESSEKPKRKR